MAYKLKHISWIAGVSLVISGCSTTPEQPVIPPPPPAEIAAEKIETTPEPSVAKVEPASEQKTIPKEPVAEPPKKVVKKVTPVKKKVAKSTSKPKPKSVKATKPKAKTKKTVTKPAKKVVKKPTQVTQPKLTPTAPDVKDPALPENASIVEADEGASTSEFLADLNQLPLAIGNNWTLNRDMSGAGGCLLNYRQLEMFDGHDKTKVNLSVSGTTIVFKTKSNIDTSYEDSGVKVDDGDRLRIERLDDETSIAYTDNYDTLIKSFLSGKSAQLSLGFWPTWPVTQTHSLEIDISEFNQAHHALNACVALEQQLR